MNLGERFQQHIRRFYYTRDVLETANLIQLRGHLGVRDALFQYL